MDSYGDGCDWYDAHPSGCGYYDTADFNAHAMCCACQDPEAPPPADEGTAGAFYVGDYYYLDEEDERTDVFISIQLVNGMLIWSQYDSQWTDASEFSLTYNCSSNRFTMGEDSPYGSGEIEIFNEGGLYLYIDNTETIFAHADNDFGYDYDYSYDYSYDYYEPEQQMPTGISMSVSDNDDVVVASAAPVAATPVINDPNGTGVTEMGPLADIVANSNSALTEEEKC